MRCGLETMVQFMEAAMSAIATDPPQFFFLPKLILGNIIFAHTFAWSCICPMLVFECIGFYLIL